MKTSRDAGASCKEGDIVSFEGKVAIVTGGASGIGEAVCKTLAARGAKVVVADYNAELGAKVAAAVGGEFFEIDVTDAAANKAMVEFAVEKFGRLDYAVNNAGISGPQGAITDISEEEYRRVIAVNQDAVFYAMKYEIPELLKTKGAIVNVSSILGVVAAELAVCYVSSKHAVSGMTKAAGVYYASKGVRINSVHPGYIDTPLLAGLPASVLDPIVGAHPINRLGTAEEVAAVVCFLLSEEAAFVVGSQYLVDGGYTSV